MRIWTRKYIQFLISKESLVWATVILLPLFTFTAVVKTWLARYLYLEFIYIHTFIHLFIALPKWNIRSEKKLICDRQIYGFKLLWHNKQKNNEETFWEVINEQVILYLRITIKLTSWYFVMLNITIESQQTAWYNKHSNYISLTPQSFSLLWCRLIGLGMVETLLLINTCTDSTQNRNLNHVTYWACLKICIQIII